jgi:acetyl esterase/lipase
VAPGTQAPGLLRFIVPAVGLVLLAGGLLWMFGFKGAPRPDEMPVYKRVDGHTLSLHVFRAQGRSAPTPALVWFHGGAWAHGSPVQFYPQCQHFSRLGLTCISVEYRIASRHGSTPAQAVQDARDALRHLRRHAQALGLDPQRVVAGGGSAGGHLAAALGVQLPDARPPPGDPDTTSARPDALVLLNPMLDLSPGQPDHPLVAPGWQALSPLHHVGPGVPPTLVLNGTADPEVPVATVQRFCAAVREAGTGCELALFEGGSHGFFNPQVDGGRHHGPSNAAIEAFLRRQGLL